MPPSAMIAPASTKNGIVSIATLLTPSEIFSITASSGMPIDQAPAIAASRQRIGDRHADQKADQHGRQQNEDIHVGPFCDQSNDTASGA